MSKLVKKNKHVHQFGKRATIFLGSKFFWKIVLVFYAIQALWVAFSFRFPLLYDESTHFATIQLYSHSFSPFISGQPTSYDVYGDLTNHGSTLYHYLMTFPYRFIEHITHSFTWQIIFLRTINILLFGLGIVVFCKLFKTLGIKQIFINIAILFFILLPMVPFLAATINYDNLLFPLASLFLLWGVKIIKASNPNWRLYMEFLIIGALALLVKYASAPIIAIGVVYISIEEINRHRKGLFEAIGKSFRESSKRVIIALFLVVIAVAAMLSQVYVRDYLKYHTFFPACQQTLGQARCSTNFITQHTSSIAATKNERSAASFPNASGQWLTLIETDTDFSAINKPLIGTVYAKPLPIIYWLVFIFSILGAVVIIVSWRLMLKNRSIYFLMAMFFFYTLTVFLFNMNSYYKNNAFTAVQPRYLLETLPIFILLAVLAFNTLLRNFAHLKLPVLTAVFILALQGGGVITHIVRSDQTWYWQNNVIKKVNKEIKGGVGPLIVK